MSVLRCARAVCGAVLYGFSDTDGRVDKEMRRKRREKLYKGDSYNITQLRNQLSKLQDLLETGVYSADTYVERSKVINDRIAAASATLAELRQSQPVDERAAIIRLKPMPLGGNHDYCI